MKHIAIVGAGIGGLTVAHRLLEAGYAGRLSIYDKRASAGGRLMSQRVADDGLVVELGAGRLHPVRHPRLHALCTEMGVALKRFDYPARYQWAHDAPDLARRWLAAALAALQRAQHDPGRRRGHGFADFCRQVVGDYMARQLHSACGYDSLLHPHLPVEAGLSILQDHPETESLFAGQDSQWLCVRDGLQALAGALQRRLGDRVNLHLGAEMQGIERSSDGAGGWRLRLTGERGDFRDRADLVVVASLPQDAGKIAGWPACGEETHGRSLDGIPLLKGYVQFASPWWQSTLPGSSCLIADSPLRKLYVTAGSRTLWFYCDGPSARSLNDTLGEHGGVPAEMLEQQLGCRMPAGTQAQQCRWKFWEHGIGFYREPRPQRHQGQAFELAGPDLLLCSDIFTEHLGWVEGSLVSAQAAVDHLQAQGDAFADAGLAMAA